MFRISNWKLYRDTVNRKKLLRNRNVTSENKKVLALKHKKINLLITGATGCGKSSTINAMFDTEVAKVGCMSSA